MVNIVSSVIVILFWKRGLRARIATNNGGLLVLCVSGSKELLVDLAHARAVELIDEQNGLRDAVFRNDARVHKPADMGLDRILGRRLLGLVVANNERHRAFTPLLVLDADNGGFSDARGFNDDVFKLQG